MRNDLTAEFIRAILTYNRQTGELRWKVNRPPRGKKGELAGTIDDNGYVQIGINGKLYYAHRVAFVIVKGRWPAHGIDHKKGKPGDNRWHKIREASASENSQNRGPQSNNKSGVKGVYWHAKRHKWQVFIDAEYLGIFASKKTAITVRRQAAKELHGEFARFK